MRIPSIFGRASICAAVAVSPVMAQSAWECADDSSTVVVNNSGTVDQSFTFKMNAQAQYDGSLSIRVVTLNAKGDVVEVHQTIEWNYGTDATVVVGAGRSIEIVDPQDTDAKKGKGTYEQN